TEINERRFKVRHCNSIEQLRDIHPGFVAERGVVPSIVLHRFAPEGDYYSLRARLLGRIDPLAEEDGASKVRFASRKKYNSRRTPVESLPEIDGVTMKRSERNTPALWGGGAIDSIPVAALQAEEQRQKGSKEISGRIPRAQGGGVGKFGWRGQ